MKFQHLFLALISLLFSCNSESGQKNNQFIIDQSLSNIYVDKDSDDLIKWAANDLSEDIGQILGKRITIHFADKINPDTKGIYIGKFDDREQRTATTKQMGNFYH